MRHLRVQTTLDQAEAQLKDLLAEQIAMISVTGKDNQELICDALDDVQCAIRSLLMTEGEEDE